MEMKRPSQCRMCKRMFRSKQGLAAHVQSSHLTSKSPREPLNTTSSRKSPNINSPRKSTEINSSSSNLTPDSSSPRQAPIDIPNNEKKDSVIITKEKQILDTIDLSLSPLKQTAENVPSNNLTPDQVPNNNHSSKQVPSTSEITVSEGTKGSPSPVKLDVEIPSQDQAPSTASLNKESKNTSENNFAQHSPQSLKRKLSEPDLIESTPGSKVSVLGPPTSYSSTTAVYQREGDVIIKSPTPIQNTRLTTISVYIPDSSSTKAKADVLETTLSPIRYSLSALGSNLSHLEDKEMTLEINNNTSGASSCRNNPSTSETDSSTMDLITLETNAITLEAKKTTLETDEITLENDWNVPGDHKNMLESVDNAISNLLDLDQINSSTDNIINITLAENGPENDWLNQEKPRKKQSHITLLSIMNTFKSAERDFKTALGAYSKEPSTKVHKKYVKIPFKSSKVDDEIIQLDSSDKEEGAASAKKPKTLKASTLNLQVNTNSEVKIICRFCPLNFKSMDIMTSHIEKSHPSKKNKIFCNTCGEIFKSKQSLTEHENLEHSFEQIVID